MYYCCALCPGGNFIVIHVKYHVRVVILVINTLVFIAYLLTTNFKL